MQIFFFSIHILAVYGLRRKRPMKVYGVSCVLYTDDQTVISCSILDG